jgi:gamma-glutamylcyclotransferase (GGCT)/AIG2-like uncharacterized protein YtfP
VSPGPPPPPFYFAYGSNLSIERLRRRVGPVVAAGTGWLAGHRLSFGKLGRDGTGKATVVVDAGARVWGALYRLPPEAFAALDCFEPGYERSVIEVVTAGERRVEAATYRAPEAAARPIPHSEYKRIVVTGAREHALPHHWIEALLRVPEHPPGGRG